MQTETIIVSERGFKPAQLSLQAGVRARLTFRRTTDKTCGTEVVFPSLNMKRALPLNDNALIEFMLAKPGTLAFACGMNMLKGQIAVVAAG